MGGPPRGMVFSSISFSRFPAKIFISFTLSGCWALRFFCSAGSFDKSIRVGDIVLLYSDKDELIGSGVAQAPAWEWNQGCGRLVKVRHRL